MKNIAFIDGQNLHLGTRKDKESSWKIDNTKFRKLLKDSYNVEEAYYYIGCFMEKYQELYNELEEAGFNVKHKEHSKNMYSEKKGNVDNDIIFDIMKNLFEQKISKNKRVILVSGDGDYYKMVCYLAKIDILEIIIFPNGKKSSSLYNNLDSKYKLVLNRYDAIRNKIARV